MDYREMVEVLLETEDKEVAIQIENYEEYSRKESNIAFIEELGRKYAGEVY